MTSLTKFRAYLFAFLVFGLIWACSNDDDESTAANPYMKIENGQFMVEANLNTDTTSQNRQLLGSGTITFSFSGDTSGTFFASGPLYLNQGADSAGVGALLDRVFNTAFNRVDESLSLLAFVPGSNGKTDVLSIGTRFFEPVDTLQAGLTYRIGPSAPFIASYFKGLNIIEFWDGQSNFFETADRAFSFSSGSLTITERDNNRVSGTFSATTDPRRDSASGPYLLK